MEEKNEINANDLAGLEQPIVDKITHHSFEINWKHIKENLPRNQKFKFLLQERSQKNKLEWNTIYT